MAPSTLTDEDAGDALMGTAAEEEAVPAAGPPPPPITFAMRTSLDEEAFADAERLPSDILCSFFIATQNYGTETVAGFILLSSFFS